MKRAGVRAAEEVLYDRLRTVRGVLGSAQPLTDQTDGLDLLLEVVDLVRDQDDSSAWLLLVGLTGAFPDAAAVRSVRRALAMRGSEESAVWLLDSVAPLAMQGGDAEATLRVVTDRPLVDVTFTARSNLLTGIQRVVRGVVAQWEERHDVTFVAWTSRGGAFRSLQPAELRRLTSSEVDAYEHGVHPEVAETHEIIVPWGVPVVLTEVPSPEQSDRLAAVAELTDSPVRLVGYDCIPVSSAEMVALAEPEKFGRYLELVKFADRLAAISKTAAIEFEGFASALRAQGLAGPQITACPLPHTALVVGGHGKKTAPLRPLVMCVGSIGHRKNQTALVEAAEVLWREGLDFELRLLGHLSPERSPLIGLLPELQELGRPLFVEPGVSDDRIAVALSHARCLVFPSLHEGFGLPVVEALSHGVPVITSDFGSLREVAEGQGGLLVDPEDVGALADAIRDLLTSDALHARLVAEARERPVRTWSDYAAELWEVLLR